MLCWKNSQKWLLGSRQSNKIYKRRTKYKPPLLFSKEKFDQPSMIVQKSVLNPIIQVHGKSLHSHGYLSLVDCFLAILFIRTNEAKLMPLFLGLGEKGVTFLCRSWFNSSFNKLAVKLNNVTCLSLSYIYCNCLFCTLK